VTGSGSYVNVSPVTPTVLGRVRDTTACAGGYTLVSGTEDA
jgi:hypothetical protein